MYCFDNNVSHFKGIVFSNSTFCSLGPGGILIDKVFCADRPGSGMIGDERILLDLSQAVNREVMQTKFFPCILPGSKMLDMSSCTLYSGYTLLRLQGLVSSTDYILDYSCISERVAASLAGNAMAGWGYGTSFLTQLRTSHSKPITRICNRLKWSSSRGGGHDAPEGHSGTSSRQDDLYQCPPRSDSNLV